MPDTTVIRYVGPSRQPIVIADTGQVVVHADAPPWSRLPDQDGVVPAETVEVDADLAERLCRQASWEPVEEPDVSPVEDDFDGEHDPDGGPLSDTPATAGDPTYDQEV
jgi:hypothetical protein